MDRIRILDCTLRDGGYVNNFEFGEDNIKEIIRKLSAASIDIIECGFLKSGAFDANFSLYGSIEAVKNAIGQKNEKLMYVAMIQYGGISNDEIAPCVSTSIDGIRLTFHEHEIDPAFVLGKQLMDKGYKVFMQPVGTITYTDEALLHLIQKVNELRPYSFYMVDTLGTMYKNDLLRMYYLIDHNLDKNIVLGFHSHNNLQLSFANAQELMQLNTDRNIVIDASILGMGRGAGNLNTELVTQYINANLGLKYDNLEILEVMDEYIKPLSLQFKWGYDAPYYIASISGCHPNYASFLINKQTLHIQDIYAILGKMKKEKRALFDKEYIGEEYLSYLSKHVDDQETISALKENLSGKNVILIAPGKSLIECQDKIRDTASKKNCTVISVNFIPDSIPVDYMFISNLKRFKNVDYMMSHAGSVPVIATSNLTTGARSNLHIVNFSSYLNDEQCISDNAGLMAMNLMKKVGVKELILAGFDGFSSNPNDNYVESSMLMDVETERLMKMNIATAEKLKQLRTQMQIEFLTSSVYA